MKDNTKMLFDIFIDNGYDTVFISPSSISERSYQQLTSIDRLMVVEIVDERSAGYAAIGFIEETENNVILYTENEQYARNYAPAITEAYYRKMPIIVLSNVCTKKTDNSQYPQDTYGRIFDITCFDEERNIVNEIGNVLNMARANGGQPVFISVNYSKHYFTDYNGSKDFIANNGTKYAEIAHKYLSNVPMSTNIFIDSNVLIHKDDFSNLRHFDNGLISITVGASVSQQNEPFVCIALASTCALELNALGNRHIGDNFGLVIINDNDKYTKAIIDLCKSWGYKITDDDYLSNDGNDGVHAPSLIIIK
jgi:hypothetical protein